ncbi:MAG: hypothetical protein WBH96_06955, partial [Dysgonamonadaceae bacterium]
WYVEANSNAGFSEGSIILAQTALELIYNWWIVENKKIILGKDSENISVELLTLLRQKVKHKKLTFVEYEKTKNTLRQGI